jgi:flagellar transcriptional activator FlhD
MTKNNMTQEDLLMEIRDSNLSYLMLAQQMIRSDKASAIFRLGLSVDVANFLVNLSNSQLIKLANSNMMLARFRFDDTAILGMLTNYKKTDAQSRVHSSILMSAQAVEVVN